jgi:GNAT superfamily N-acetyltransferase
VLTKASKCSGDIVHSTANMIYDSKEFLKENFAFCSNPREVDSALATSDSWFILSSNQPTAVFKLETSGPAATISHLCLNPTETLEAILSGLREELRKIRVTNIVIRANPGDAEHFTANGFERQLSYDRFSRVPEVTKMMPILPLISATQKEIPTLSRLMYDSYSKTDRGFPDTQSTEKSLRAIMSGSRGPYMPDASFASGTLPNLVSACLVTLDSPGEAKIEQLFTHPLYRARGLATTEIAAAMNRLVASGVQNLTLWNRDGNDVVRRLLNKMGFKKDRTVVEMISRI